jgi:hypothetical protein
MNVTLGTVQWTGHLLDIQTRRDLYVIRYGAYVLTNCCFILQEPLSHIFISGPKFNLFFKAMRYGTTVPYVYITERLQYRCCVPL